MITILHLEDDPNDAELVRAVVRDRWPDCRILLVSSEAAFNAALHAAEPDLILSDFTLGAFNGLEALRLAKRARPDTPFIFLSGTIGEDRAIEAMRAGAQDYVLKNNLKRLGVAVERGLRDAAEQRHLRAAERRLLQQAQMIEQARDAIFITDLDDRIITWNRGAERLFGWKAVDVIGRRFAELVPPEDLAPLAAAAEAALSAGEWHGELRLHGAGGTPLVVKTSQTLVRDDAGRPQARLAINTDVTEQKQLEAQFLRAQRMENIGLLAAGIAHDLNNMLAPILMAVPMLRSSISQPTPLRMLETVERCAERGAALTRQILAFAHGSGGELRLVQVKHLLRDVGGIVEQTFPKNITLDSDYPPHLWPVQANPVQIHQVLLNLCVNARDAMPDGGTLRLHARNETLDSSTSRSLDARPGPQLVIEVGDTGTGIAPEILARMWEPFFTTKAADKGTGLGLATVRGIVANHGGAIAVETEPGRGTVFRIYLPAAEDNARPPESPSPLPSGNGELILVVDDDPSIRQLCATLLTRHGYRIALATDGADAVSCFAQRGHDIRLVLSDIQMPGFDGLALARVLRQINPTIKMVAMTGMPATLDRLNEASDIIAGCLLKPFTVDALIRRVHELLHSTSAST